MAAWAIVVLAGAVPAVQWFGTERLALAVTGARRLGQLDTLLSELR